jgi:hypothetical protein
MNAKDKKQSCGLTISEGLAVLCMMGFANIAQGQNLPVAHWINAAGSNVVSVLNANLNLPAAFVTDFKGHNDLKVTRLTADRVTSVYTDAFGGSSPGNNPAYLTNFVGASNNGTGDGTKGHFHNLEMTTNATGTLQFDFAEPLTSYDRILLTDTDQNEQYSLQAYYIDGVVSNQVSFVGWPATNYSGQTGITPDARWPIWNPAQGTLVSGGTLGTDLNEELFVLTPAQNISRLIITKQSAAVFTTEINFISLQVPLQIQQAGSNVLLTWTNSAFSLQTSPSVSGSYTNIPGATTPYTRPTSAPQEFFRLNAD